jgi:hypothetical protein
LGRASQQLLEDAQRGVGERHQCVSQAWTVKAVYTTGHPDPELISPDNWSMNSHYLARPNAKRVQLDFFYDYRTNVELYEKWQTFLKKHQPKTIIFWGQGNIFFTPAGGEASQGPPGGGDAPLAVRPFCRRGSSHPDFSENKGILRQESTSGAVVARNRILLLLGPCSER